MKIKTKKEGKKKREKKINSEKSEKEFIDYKFLKKSKILFIVNRLFANKQRVFFCSSRFFRYYHFPFTQKVTEEKSMIHR